MDAALDAAGVSASRARAVVSPHAGLIYSGHVAAHSYRALGSSPREAVVLVGPSHYEAFRGCAMLRQGALETPWGTLPIAESLADALAAQTSLVSRAFEQIHAREHSLELQLPFLARVLPETPVIPILMGDQSRSVAFGLGDALAETFAGRDVALVASSDLSHYQDATTARRMDRVVLDSLDAMDPERLMAALEREPHHACGGGPMVAVLRAARRMGADGGRRAQIRGLRRRLWRQIVRRRLRERRLRRAGRMTMTNVTDGAALVALARTALEAAVRRHGAPAPPQTPLFQRRAGAFVTLRKQHELRGCIGQPEPHDPLGSVIVHCAAAAALEDPRFPAVEAARVAVDRRRRSRCSPRSSRSSDP